MAGEVEALEALEDRVAQVVLHVEGDPATDEPADVRQREVGDAGHHEHGDQRPQGLAVGDDHVVDHRPLDERGDDRDERRAERDAECDQYLALVAREERPQSADPPGRFRGRHRRRRLRAGRLVVGLVVGSGAAHVVGAAHVERVAESGECIGDDGRVVAGGEEHVESGTHRLLGRA